MEKTSKGFVMQSAAQYFFMNIKNVQPLVCEGGFAGIILLYWRKRLKIRLGMSLGREIGICILRTFSTCADSYIYMGDKVDKKKIFMEDNWNILSNVSVESQPPGNEAFMPFFQPMELGIPYM